MITITFSFPAVRPPLESSFAITSTIRTAKEFIAKFLTTCPDNIVLQSRGSSMPDSTPLTHVPGGSLLVVVNQSRIFRFWYARDYPTELPFKETASVADAKCALSPKLKVFPEQIDLQVNGQSLDDDFMLTDLILPSNGGIDVEIFNATEEDEVTYLFMLQGEGVSLALKKSATVADAIQELMQIVHHIIGPITLSFDGNPLKDESALLTDIKVPRGEFIVAETRPVSCVELRSRRRDELFSRPSSSRTLRSAHVNDG
jgi:hypothetical protein